MSAIEIIEHAGLTISIYADDTPENPRDFMGGDAIMMCREHRRYTLGDVQTYENDPDAMQAAIIEEYGPTRVMIPLWFYDHSSQAMSVRSFEGRAQHASWDSGWCGFIFMTDADIRRVYEVKRITRQLLLTVRAALIAQVEVYSEYLSGNVFGYEITDPNDEDADALDACWGFYGWDDVISSAKESAEYIAKMVQSAEYITVRS